MKDDPVVEEIREYRQALMAEYDNDLNKLCAALREQEKHSQRTIVRRKPRLVLNPTGS